MKYLVDGCYGDQNAGDEALLRAVCHILRKHDRNAQICAISADPNATFNLHNIRAVQNTNPFGRNLYGGLCKSQLSNILRSIRACDIFIVGGGELLRDDVGLNAILGTFYRAALAKILGKQVYALGVGAQPSVSWIAGTVLSKLIACFDRIVLRDPTSMKSLEVLTRLEKTAFSWMPDLVFGLDWSSSPPRPSRGEHEPLRVGLAIKGGRPHRASISKIQGYFSDASFRAISELAQRTRVLPVLLAYAPDDRSLLEALRARFERINIPVEMAMSAQFDRLRASVSSLDVMISMPLHGSVFALASGVPTIGVAYDPKVTKLFASLSLAEFCITLDGTNEAAISLMLRKALRSPGIIPLLQGQSRSCHRLVHATCSDLLAQARMRRCGASDGRAIGTSAMRESLPRCSD